MEAVNEISMDGFQIVSSDFFSFATRSNSPTLTVWDGSIGFSKQDILLLNSCENIMIQINAKEKKALVVPTKSSDKDAIKWVKRLDPVEARKIKCPKLTDKLYEMWDWDKDCVYRTNGRLVTAGSKVMLLFDFAHPEQWKRPEAKHA